MKQTMLALLSVVVVVAGWCHSSPVMAQQPQKVSEIEGISEYQMDNGVQLLLFPDSSKPQVTVAVTILVGSRHEGYGETGMAHLLEHMLFKGTPTHRDIPKLLKDRGVLNMNGTTWYDRTNYYETLPAEGDNLEFMLRMESDRLLNSFIDPNELAKEMTVVRNEFEMNENSPTRILFQRILANAYEWHNYGKTTIGNRTDIERVPPQNLRAFYKKYYRPDNIMVTIAGKFDEDQALELANEYFGALENPPTKLPKTYTEEPTQDGERVVVLRRVGDVQVTGVGYHIPPASHEDYPACEVLSSILGIEPSGRLYKGLVETELATSVSTQMIAGHDPGMMLAFCEVPKSGDLDKARDEMLRQVAQVAEKGVEESEVKRIVKRMSKRHEQELANSSAVAINLSDWRAYGDWRLYFLHRDRVEKVTAADVQRVAKKYCLPSNRTVGMFYPTASPVRASIPSPPRLDTLLADYKGRKKIAAGESFDPTPDNIDARTDIGVFESGVKYAMLPKKSRGERVTLSGVLKYGTLDSLNGKAEVCEMFPSMLTRGTESLDFQQFRDRLDEINTNLSISGVPGAMSINLSTKRENFSAALDLLKESLRKPAWDQKRFDELKRQNITDLENSLSDPQAKAFIAFQQKLAPYSKGDPRYVPSVEENIESLKAISLEDLRATYDRFVSGEHGQFAIVGDFDPEVAKSKLDAILSDWSTNEEYARIATPAETQVEGQRVTIDTPDKANSVYVAGMHIPIRDDSEDFQALEIGNYILGGGPLSSRLADRVRKKEGLSYGVGSMFQASPIDERGVLLMFAISNPTNTEKVVGTVKEEVERMLTSGVTGEELEKARDSFIKNRQGGRSNDGTLASTLLRNLEADRTMEFHKQADAKIQLLSKDQVDETIRRYLDPKRLVIVTAGDFSKSESGSDEKQENEK